MRHLKYVLVLSIAITTVFTGCEKNMAEPSDQLEQFGILGQWKLESREVNGISSLAVDCCDYLKFQTDNTPTDLSGLFHSKGTGYETNGVFKLDRLNESIEFVFDDKLNLYGMKISDTRIVFTYSESNDAVLEHWVKEE